MVVSIGRLVTLVGFLFPPLPGFKHLRHIQACEIALWTRSGGYRKAEETYMTLLGVSRTTHDAEVSDSGAFPVATPNDLRKLAPLGMSTVEG